MPTESTMEAAVDVAVAEKLDPSRRWAARGRLGPRARCSAGARVAEGGTGTAFG